jgi:two-component system sensor histidine kinase VicK
MFAAEYTTYFATELELRFALISLIYRIHFMKQSIRTLKLWLQLTGCISLLPHTAIETTKVYYGEEDAMKILLQAMINVKKEAVICSDANSLAFSIAMEPVKKLYIACRETGVRIRQIVEITKDNLHYCKEFMEYVELRHMDNIKGNMAVSETEYVATAVLEGSMPVTQTIYSNVKAFLEQQHYFFENLWSKAIPAEQRIREIEQGVEPQRIEVIYDAGQALELYQSLIMSAEKEIKVVFPTTNAIIRQDKAGILFLLQEAAAAAVKKCQVKVLMPNDELIRNFIPTNNNNNNNNNSNISTRFIDQHESGKATILIVDNKVSLVMELKDDSKKTFHEAIGLSTYSNSKAGVLSYVSMFESLWKQTELYEELKSNEKMQKEFINTAAHELRTPVQPILGMAELIESSFEAGKGKTEISKDDIEIILRNAKRLERLSSDVLEIARIESQSLRLNKERFSLKEVISGSIRDTENQIVDRDITISYNPKKDIVVYADKGRISEVISNILDNAIKFTHQGNITISTEVKNNNNEAIVLTRDEGTGIDDEIASRLFTKFATKSEKGTGLGLYISKGIVEAHGGKIWAKNNEEDKGATFGFSVPLN